MKIPKARRLQSGSWFVRVTVNGKVISITRNTQREAEAEAAAIKAGILDTKKKKGKTVTAAIDQYIENRENILSPSTIRGYRAIQRLRFQGMMSKDIYSIGKEEWQRAVNLEAKSVSAKTLTNSWRFLVSVIAEETGERISVRLPQIVNAERPWLTPEEIPIFVKAVKGTSVEIPALLALSSLRRSEILHLQWSDVNLKEKYISVNGSAVYDENGKLVQKKETKNVSSRRHVPLIPPLEEALKAVEEKEGTVVKAHPMGIFKHINRICKSADLPEVGFHGLRHSFASLAYHLGISEKSAMRIGGWSNDQTMRKIYTHISNQSIDHDAQEFTKFFNSTD